MKRNLWSFILLLFPVFSLAQETTPDSKEDEKSVFEAVQKGKLDKVKELLTKDPNLVHIRGWQENTPLHEAALYGQLEIVKLLVEKGADVNATSKIKHTPLFRALLNQDPVNQDPVYARIVDFLLKSKADPNIREKSVNWTPLHKAAHEAAHEIFKLLLDHGADPHALDKDGCTVLHWAVVPVWSGDTMAILQMLADKKVDMNVRSKKGSTALDWAKKRGNPKVIEFLEKNGAKE